MKPRYSAIFSRPRLEPKMFTGLSESQLIQTMLTQGIHTLSSIVHEGNSGTSRPVEGKEMIGIWKRVFRMIQNRLQKQSRQLAATPTTSTVSSGVKRGQRSVN